MDRREKRQAQYVLANMVVDLVRSRGLKAGHHLTEQWLAEELSVSRTPIRAALRLLADAGLVESRARYGFFLAKDADRLDRTQSLTVPATPEQQLYAAVVRDRVSGRLPDSMTQTEFVRRYAVNRIVLLRVLSRMADEGLIARNKGQGWTFQPGLDSARALRASYDFRITLEPAGLLLASFSADPTVLGRLRSDHETVLAAASPPRPGVLFELDAAFHETLASFSGNPYFVQAVQQQNRLRRLLEYQGYENRHRIRVWISEHLAVLEALANGDRQQAARRLTAHLENALSASPSPDAAAETVAAPHATARGAAWTAGLDPVPNAHAGAGP